VSDALIEARDVSVTFGSGSRAVRAVRGVSLHIDQGEAVGIVGESGSGKSTLARVLAGLQRPDSGEVLFDGENIYQRGKAYRGDKRRLVQMVFQDPYGSLNPRITALSAVSEAVRVHGAGSRSDAIARSLDLLAQMGISERDAKKKPRQLSGGQRQRVSVARALSAQPAVLLADEPTSAIDQSAQAQLLNLFQGLLDGGLSIALVSHDLGVIRYLTQRVYVMKDGEFVESGPTIEVFDNPTQDYTKKLIASIPGRELRKART
jgi:peptide/nickel transport system ATP-binding protein